MILIAGIIFTMDRGADLITIHLITHIYTIIHGIIQHTHIHIMADTTVVIIVEIGTMGMAYTVKEVKIVIGFETMMV